MTAATWAGRGPGGWPARTAIDPGSLGSIRHSATDRDTVTSKPPALLLGETREPTSASIHEP